jgi:hypothetical protein
MTSQITRHDWDGPEGEQARANGAPADNLEGAREAGAAFLAAADEAAERALSRDSRQFNLASHQEGGE